MRIAALVFVVCLCDGRNLDLDVKGRRMPPAEGEHTAPRPSPPPTVPGFLTRRKEIIQDTEPLSHPLNSKRMTRRPSPPPTVPGFLARRKVNDADVPATEWRLLDDRVQHSPRVVVQTRAEVATAVSRADHSKKTTAVAASGGSHLESKGVSHHAPKHKLTLKRSAHRKIETRRASPAPSPLPDDWRDRKLSWPLGSVEPIELPGGVLGKSTEWVSRSGTDCLYLRVLRPRRSWRDAVDKCRTIVHGGHLADPASLEGEHFPQS
jgi:hypothetical protein